MARDRTSSRMKDQIKQLHSQGYSLRAIERSLRVSVRTIKKVLGIAEPLPPAPKPDWHQSVAWDKVKDEVNRRGVTIKQLHREHAPGVPYLTFWRAFRELSPTTPEVTMRLVHRPGEKTQIDFTDGIAVVDPKTGIHRRTHLFTGVLAFSSRIYAEFVFDQRLPSFMAAQERMWQAFGGVTPYVVVDNLKSGVARADIYDPDVNPTYLEFANHMGFCVLPARPYKPRDKGKNEASNNVLQRTFFQEVRDRVFYSLGELNRALLVFLGGLNDAVMKDYGVSRNDRFAEERQYLKPLPERRFEVSEWRRAKVHPDCHIQVAKNFYSVPFTAVGRTVRVRLTAGLVEVFSDDGDSLAVHRRLDGSAKFSTHPGHYPQPKVVVAHFEITHAKAEASVLGPNVRSLVDELTGGDYPLRHLRRIQGILRLARSGGVAPGSLDYGCEQALKFRQMRLAYIKSCALFHQVNGGRPTVTGAPRRDLNDVHLNSKVEGGTLT